jgi:CheY-like chemotaxis protein/anti-sigma regulatory factor (Ser/Thr protein kinase)
MTLSHELRTPMTAVLGWSRLLPVLDPSEPAFKAAIEGIARSAQLQAQLIDDLLDVSRIIAGKLHLKVESSSIAAIVKAAVDTVRTAADAKSIRIEVDLEDDLGHADVDSMRIQQAVWNLITNAVKFSSPGGRVELHARRDDGSLRITVRDWGKGIDPEFLPYLFEPFRQAEAPTTRHHGGLGLGLSIARYLVESHGGQLTAASEGIGRGSTFEIVLPIRATKTPAAPGAQVVKREMRPLEGIDTLIVEDDPAGRDFLRAALSRGGAIVRTADSVRHALQRIEETCPDLMLTDIGLPDEDGYELVRRVRADTRCANMRVAALTAFAGDRNANATATMLDAYFVKPVDPFALVNDLAKLFVKPR